MSGPIVRKYGFPNFDKIFGERELQHGVDDPAAETAAAETETAPAKAPKAPKAKAKAEPKSKAKKK